VFWPVRVAGHRGKGRGVPDSYGLNITGFREALVFLADFVTTAGGTSARDRTMKGSNIAVVADFGGEVGRVG
jgi:hypothetical protein